MRNHIFFLQTALIIILSLISAEISAGDQWTGLRKKADELYSGFDISAKIRTGYQALEISVVNLFNTHSL